MSAEKVVQFERIPVLTFQKVVDLSSASSEIQTACIDKSMAIPIWSHVRSNYLHILLILLIRFSITDQKVMGLDPTFRMVAFPLKTIIFTFHTSIYVRIHIHLPIEMRH